MKEHTATNPTRNMRHVEASPISWKIPLEVIPGRRRQTNIRKQVEAFFERNKNLQAYRPKVSFSDNVMEVWIKTKSGSKAIANKSIDFSLLIDLLVLGLEDLPKKAKPSAVTTRSRPRKTMPMKRAARYQPLLYS